MVMPLASGNAPFFGANPGIIAFAQLFGFELKRHFYGPVRNAVTECWA